MAMALALVKAGPLKADIRLAQAISQFEADLSTEQKAAFWEHRSQCRKSPPGFHDVMLLMAEIDHESAKSDGARCVGPRLGKILEAVQQFAELGDIIVGGSQSIIASGLWTLVRMTLLSIVRFPSFEEMTALFMSIGHTAPRIEEMALLYPQSEVLQSHLSEYFIVVVRLCHRLLNMAKRPALEKFRSALGDSDMKNYQSELNRWDNSIRDVMNLMTAKSIKKNNSHLRTVLRFTGSESARQRRKAHKRLLDACSTYDHQTTWKEIRKLGNASLFNGSDEYCTWKAREYSCTLLCKGKLGSGKSVLLANMVDDLHLHVQGSETPVAFFFCRHDIHESLRARTVIGSLARQLLISTLKLNKQTESVADIPAAFNSEEIFSVLQRTIPSGFKAHVVLDGLDECDDAERRTLIEQLGKLQTIFTLRLCVSFRLEADNSIRSSLAFGLSQLAESSSIAMPDENPDIERFIRAELASMRKSEKLVIGDPELIFEIEAALQRGAQGMFLWATLQIESLCAAQTDQAIRLALQNLPKDLPETFSRILRRSARPGGEHYQKQILELVTAAHHPLTTEELGDALSVVPGDTRFDRSQLLNSVCSVLAYCGSLITVDEEASTVRLVHHSLKQFLFDEFGCSPVGTFTFNSVNKTMGDIIVTYLNYDVFRTTLSTTIPRMPMEAVPAKVVDSIELPSFVKNGALRALGRHSYSRQREHDTSRTLVAVARSAQPPSVHTYHFQPYAKSYWLQHAQHASEFQLVSALLLLEYFDPVMDGIKENRDGLDALLTEAIRSSRRELEPRLIRNGFDPRCDRLSRASLSEAAEAAKRTLITFFLQSDKALYTYGRHLEPWLLVLLKGYECIVGLLSREEANLDQVNRRNRTLLSLIIGMGLEAVVSFLLKKGADIEAKDSGGRTPLSIAALRGLGAIGKLLIEKGADTETKDLWGRTPLSVAAESGAKDVVQLLIEKGADIEAKDLEGQTPLSVAAVSGTEDVVQLLIEKGADTETKDLGGRTPLSVAAESGLKDVVQLLIEKGADIEARDIKGRTPLIAAYMSGYTAVVELLIEKGACRGEYLDFGRSRRRAGIFSRE